MISIRNSKETKIAGDYAIIKHNNVPVALIIQAFEKVSNSYDLYFATYNYDYYMQETQGNPTIQVGKTCGIWHGYNLYKRIKTRNTSHSALQLIEKGNITIEDYSSITHPLKVYLEYSWVDSNTKETETHTIFLSDEEDKNNLELLLDAELGYDSKTVKELLDKAYPTAQEYFSKHENSQSVDAVSYIITYNENYLVKDLGRNTFKWYAPDGKFLSKSSEGEFDHLRKKNLRVWWNTDLKTLFEEMNESSNKEVSPSTKRHRKAREARGIY